MRANPFLKRLYDVTNKANRIQDRIKLIDKLEADIWIIWGRKINAPEWIGSEEYEDICNALSRIWNERELMSLFVENAGGTDLAIVTG